MTFPALVDYSYSRPSPAAIKKAGYRGALRYLGYDNRCITRAEAAALLAQGLGIGLIWETSAARPLAGYQAGVDDAKKANRCADEIGAPQTRIYYAVDFQPTTAQLNGPVSDYFRGVLSVEGRAVRAYGCASVLQRLCGDLRLFSDGWQCSAWSQQGTAPGKNYTELGNRLVLSPYASMLQNIGYVLGDSSDHNSLVKTDISWMWGLGDAGEDEMTDDDFNRIATIVGILLDHRLGETLTSNALFQDEKSQFELIFTGGRYVRRHINSPAEASMLKKGSKIANRPFIDVTKLTTEERAALEAFPEV